MGIFPVQSKHAADKRQAMLLLLCRIMLPEAMSEQFQQVTNRYLDQCSQSSCSHRVVLGVSRYACKERMAQCILRCHSPRGVELKTALHERDSLELLIT